MGILSQNKMVGPGKGKMGKKGTFALDKGKNTEAPPLGASPCRSARLMPSQESHPELVPPRRSAKLTPQRPNPPFQLRDEDNDDSGMLSTNPTGVRRSLTLILEGHTEEAQRTPSATEHTGEEDAHEPSERTNLNQQDLTASIPSGNTSLVTSTMRGPTRNLGRKRKGRLDVPFVIEVNEKAGRFVGPDSQELITKSGCILRQFAKYDDTTWKNQPQELKEGIMAKCTENSSYDGSDVVKKAFNTQFSGQHRSRQYRLHLHFKKFPSKEEALKHPPANVKEEEWASLCEIC